LTCMMRRRRLTWARLPTRAEQSGSPTDICR
jgi:hypothetical protein